MNYLWNSISKLYDTILAPVTSTRDALAEILQNVRDPASFLYERTKQSKDTDSCLRTL